MCGHSHVVTAPGDVRDDIVMRETTAMTVTMTVTVCEWVRASYMLWYVTAAFMPPLKRPTKKCRHSKTNASDYSRECGLDYGVVLLM